jgi:predicted ArsR family transcriptional regulator
LTGLVKLAKLAELKETAGKAMDAEIDRLVRSGVSYGEIAAILGVSRQAVRQGHLRRLGHQ